MGSSIFAPPQTKRAKGDKSVDDRFIYFNRNQI